MSAKAAPKILMKLSKEEEEDEGCWCWLWQSLWLTHIRTRSWGKVNGIVLLLCRLLSSPKPERERDGEERRKSVEDKERQYRQDAHTHAHKTLYCMWNITCIILQKLLSFTQQISISIKKQFSILKCGLCSCFQQLLSCDKTYLDLSLPLFLHHLSDRFKMSSNKAKEGTKRRKVKTSFCPMSECCFNFCLQESFNLFNM